MINEVEALLGTLIVIIIIYLFLWRRSKLLGGFSLILCSLSLLVPFGGTDYELIAWVGVIVSLTVLVLELAIGKMGKTQS